MFLLQSKYIYIYIFKSKKKCFQREIALEVLWAGCLTERIASWLCSMCATLGHVFTSHSLESIFVFSHPETKGSFTSKSRYCRMTASWVSSKYANLSGWGPDHPRLFSTVTMSGLITVTMGQKPKRIPIHQVENAGKEVEVYVIVGKS